ncbi:MAG: tRNA pseudouridine(38-40) synthase TruA [Firmicutes bacterium]|nr:tRNA pseudouridine(38-40) synthase TruA [Bacillota bacterium]
MAYDGSAFRGWERQRRGEATVRAALEEALAPLAGGAVRVRAAGRTDAGVHAAGQVVDLALEREIAPERLVRAVNARLPGAARVYAAEPVEEAFDARRWARAKSYVYVVWTEGEPPPFLRGRLWAPGRRLELEPMRRVAAGLAGLHDFRAYQAAGRPVASTRRRVERVEVERRGPVVLVRVTAQGFLYRMARRIVGALAAVGAGALDEAEPLRALETGRLRAATAPPEGLCLAEVRYDLAEPREVERARRLQLAAWCPWAAGEEASGALTPFHGGG